MGYPDDGSPQGGVISPLLANIYLHYVLDIWFEEEVKPRLQGQACLIRYADDFVILFTREADARRVQEVLPQRFGRFGLTLHPEKPRLVPFHHPHRKNRGTKEDSNQGPGTFGLLGFTHYWGKTVWGQWTVMRKTLSSRFTRAVRGIAQWCRSHRHLPVRQQHRTLIQKVRGHFAYYGIFGNRRAIARFWDVIQRVWRKWLDRRNNRREMTWERFRRLRERYPFPPPKIIHSWDATQRNHALRSRMR
jgi:hypothetical protein